MEESERVAAVGNIHENEPSGGIGAGGPSETRWIVGCDELNHCSCERRMRNAVPHDSTDARTCDVRRRIRYFRARDSREKHCQKKWPNAHAGGDRKRTLREFTSKIQPREADKLRSLVRIDLSV